MGVDRDRTLNALPKKKTKAKVPNKTRHQVVQRRCIDIKKKLQRYYGGIAKKANARILGPFQSVKGIVKKDITKEVKAKKGTLRMRNCVAKHIRRGNAVTRALKGAEAIVRLPTKHLSQKKKAKLHVLVRTSICEFGSQQGRVTVAVAAQLLLSKSLRMRRRKRIRRLTRQCSKYSKIGFVIL